jgi:serine-type D-Ala-D-Ala carboxypeptidase/endopeptidase
MVTSPDADPDGPHRAAIAAAVKPLIDGEVVASLVVGIHDAGRSEIYGFGKGPGGKPPNGRTLFDLGSMTKVYTGLLLADAVQRREVDLDAPIAELLPTGVTVPTRDRVSITAKHLALHSSSLPPLPPSLLARTPPPDPFAGYTEDALYQDLVTTQLAAAPGSTIALSYYGTGLLGLALGRKVGGGYSAAVTSRVLRPLELEDTFVTLPSGTASRRAIGTDENLAPRSRWTWGALVGAGGLISTVRDQLKLIEAEIDAAAGSKGTLRPAMRLTQEPQLDVPGDNEGLGWMIDSAGRLWHEGTTGGFRGYLAIDPKTRRGIVVLASTESSLVEILGRSLFDVLEGKTERPEPAPTAEQLATYAGHYDFTGTKLAVIAEGKRLYLEGPGEPRHRMAPMGGRRFWIEALQSTATFELDGDRVQGVVFGVGGRQIAAPRIEG